MDKHHNKAAPVAAPLSRKARLYSFAAVIALVGATVATPANTATYYDYVNANMNAAMNLAQTQASEAAMAALNRSLSTDEVEALRNHAGQMSLDNTAAQRAAAAREDVRDAREVTRRIEDSRQQAINAVRGGATSCNVITGLMGGSALFAQSVQWREDITSASLDYFSGGSSATDSSRGSGPGAAQRMNAICNGYATPEMIEQGVCAPGSTLDSRPRSAAGGPPRVSSALDANVFLNRSVMSTAESEASKLFAATAYAAIPMGAVPANYGATEEGRQQVAYRQAAIARQSIVQSIMGAITGDRAATNTNAIPTTVNSGNGSTGGGGSRVSLPQWMEGTAQRMIGYNPNGGNFPNGVSRHAWHEVRARSWYLDPRLQDRIGRQDANQNSKDIAAMMSFQVYLQWEQYLQAERTNAALATVVGILEESNRRAVMAGR